MYRIFLLIPAFLLLLSCSAEKVVRGQDSVAIFSPAFNYETNKIIALLPFSNSGRGGLNYPITERFAANLIWAGFTVTDRSQLEQTAAKENINLSETPPRDQLAELGRRLGVGIIVVGSCIYRQEGRPDDEGTISMISARFLDTASGETLLHATTRPDGIMPVTRALAAVIRNSLLNDLFRKGNASYDIKKYSEAIDHFTALTGLEPSLVEAYQNRGAAYSKNGDNIKALADYDRAIALYESKNPLPQRLLNFIQGPVKQPEKGELYLNRGIILLKSGKTQAAISDFNRALEAGGDPATAHANLGYARFRLKELKNSVMEYDKAVKADPSRAEFYYQRGIVLEEINVPDAIRNYSQAISLDRRFAPPLAARARANLKLGYFYDAIRDYTQALEIEPGNSEYLTGRGGAYFQARDHERAISDYSSAIKATPANCQAYMGRGISYAANGDTIQAREDFDHLLSTGTSMAGTVYLEKGILMAKSGNYSEAVENFSKALEISGNNADGYAHRGMAFERMAEYRSSVLDFSRALELRAEKPQDLFNRGYSSMQSGKYRQAIDDFSRAASLDPANSAVFSNRGYAYRQTGNYSQSINDYSRALALLPGETDSPYQRNYPDARLNQVVKEFHPYSIYYNRGLSYLATGSYRPAISDFTKAIELFPASADAYTRRGIALQQSGEMDRALSDYNRAIELDSRLADAYFGRGSWSEQSGRFSDAIADYTRAIDIMPDFSRAYFSRGLLRVQMNLEEPGITDIRAAARMNLKQARDYLMTRGAEW